MVKRGLAASRDRAQALISEGGVLVDGMPLAKPAKKLPADAEITMTAVDIPWVSRGALKILRRVAEGECEIHLKERF